MLDYSLLSIVNYRLVYIFWCPCFVWSKSLNVHPLACWLTVILNVLYSIRNVLISEGFVLYIQAQAVICNQLLAILVAVVRFSAFS